MWLSSDQRIAIKWCFLLVILGCVVGYAAGVVAVRKAGSKRGIQTLMKDENKDGRIDYILTLSNGLAQSLALDRNKDGQYDYWEYYMNGTVTRSEADNNFDGQLDQWTTFYFGFAAAMETDADGDGRVDILTSFTNGIESSSTIRITKGKRDFFTEYFDYGIRSKVVISKDGKERVFKCGKYGDIQLPEE